MAYQITVSGTKVCIRPEWGAFEIHQLQSEIEATRCASVLEKALSWLGTPFRDCADIPGPQGGVDCAMFLVRSFVDAGLLAPFDPRPYSPQWHVHHDDERFVDWITDKLGGQEIEAPQLGGLIVYQFGRCYSHGALVCGHETVVHAFGMAGGVITSRMQDTDLAVTRLGKPRPMRYFRVAA